jgi:hypothetical protein
LRHRTGLWTADDGAPFGFAPRAGPIIAAPGARGAAAAIGPAVSSAASRVGAACGEAVAADATVAAGVFGLSSARGSLGAPKLEGALVAGATAAERSRSGLAVAPAFSGRGAKGEFLAAGLGVAKVEGAIVAGAAAAERSASGLAVAAASSGRGAKGEFDFGGASPSTAGPAKGEFIAERFAAARMRGSTAALACFAAVGLSSANAMSPPANPATDSRKTLSTLRMAIHLWVRRRHPRESREISKANVAN